MDQACRSPEGRRHRHARAELECGLARLPRRPEHDHTPRLALARRPRHAAGPDRVRPRSSPGSDFAQIRRAARATGDLLRELELAPSPRSRGQGIHVWAPLKRRAHVEEVKELARRTAQVLAERHPDELTTKFRKNKREGRILVNVLRNGYAQTAVPPSRSVRAEALPWPPRSSGTSCPTRGCAPTAGPSRTCCAGWPRRATRGRTYRHTRAGSDRPQARRCNAADVTDAADELYALAPGDFTSERDALAKRLRGDGRRDEAMAVKALRKPTTPVWALNQVAPEGSRRRGPPPSRGQAARRPRGAAARRRPEAAAKRLGEGTRARHAACPRGRRDRRRRGRVHHRRLPGARRGDAQGRRERRAGGRGASRRPARARARGSRAVRRGRGIRRGAEAATQTRDEARPGTRAHPDRRPRRSSARRGRSTRPARPRRPPRSERRTPSGAPTRRAEGPGGGGRAARRQGR